MLSNDWYFKNTNKWNKENERNYRWDIYNSTIISMQCFFVLSRDLVVTAMVPLTHRVAGARIMLMRGDDPMEVFVSRVGREVLSGQLVGFVWFA